MKLLLKKPSYVDVVCIVLVNRSCNRFTSEVYIQERPQDINATLFISISPLTFFSTRWSHFTSHCGPPGKHFYSRLGLVLTPFVRLQLGLQVFGGHIEILVGIVSRPRFTSPTAAVTAAAQTATEVAAGRQATSYKQSLQVGRRVSSSSGRGQKVKCEQETAIGCRWRRTYLCPPARQHKVGVDVFFPKLLRHIQSQRTILIVNIALCWVI